MHRLEQDIANYLPGDCPCPYDTDYGNARCICHCSYDEICPAQLYFDAKRRRVQLQIRDLRRLALMNPEIATFNTLLDDGDIIHCRRYVITSNTRKQKCLVILRDLLQLIDEWNCPSLGMIRFRAILIEETWALDNFGFTFSLVTICILCLVIGCKFAYGDWGIAWNVGCFFATLVTLVLMKRV